MSVTLPATVAADKRKQAIARALDRAQAQSAMGSRPTLTSTRFDGAAIFETWAVSSRSGNGVYTVHLTHDAECISTTCDCPATDICHHRAQVRLASAGAIASINNAGLRFRPLVRKVAS